MRAIRIPTIVIFAILMGLPLTSQATTAQPKIYPPMAPCSVGVSFWYSGDMQVNGYEACDIQGIGDLGSYVPQCPQGMAYVAADWGCVFTVTSPQASPALAPASQADCPAGTFFVPAGATGLSSNTCHSSPEDPEVSKAGQPLPIISGDKSLYPVIGKGYVANTDGDGAVCRATPGGDAVLALPEGSEVVELADGVPDGWQLVDPQTGDTVCYVAAKYLSDTSVSTTGDSVNPAATAAATEIASETQSGRPPADQLVEVSTDGASNQTDSAVAGDAPVTQLPATGIGSSLVPHEGMSGPLLVGEIVLFGLAGLCLAAAFITAANWRRKEK